MPTTEELVRENIERGGTEYFVKTLATLITTVDRLEEQVAALEEFWRRQVNCNDKIFEGFTVVGQSLQRLDEALLKAAKSRPWWKGWFGR